MEYLQLEIMILNHLLRKANNLFGLMYLPMNKLGLLILMVYNLRTAKDLQLSLKELCLILVFLMLLSHRKMLLH